MRRNMSLLFAITFWALALSFAATASAASITYILVGVQLNDGGTASGSFTFDPATGLYSAANIITTTGAVRTGTTYHFVCGPDVQAELALPPIRPRRCT
jgi:hypothetical protein